MANPERPAASGKRSRRMLAILEMLAEREQVALETLASELGISHATARRDLADLSDQRLILRTHGGARSIESRNELPMSLRDTRFPDAKRAIAAEAARLIPRDRYAIALSGGTTSATVARALSAHSELTIVTNSLSIGQLVTTGARFRVIMTGGALRPESLELVGALAERAFGAINLATAILGTDGLTASGGVTTHDETEARTNSIMVAHAQRVVVVADGSKIGRLTMAKVADIDAVDVLITDPTADPAELDRIRAAGVEVRVVPG